MTLLPVFPGRFTSHCVRLSVLMAVFAGLLAPVAARAQSVTYTGSAAAQNFGSVAVNSPSSVSLSFSVTGGTTVGSIEVVTKGAPNLDFTNDAGGNCTVETYNSTTACTVGVTFTPFHPGTREGAVLFWSGSGNTGTLLNKTLLYGVGTDAGLSYTNGTVTTIGPTLPGGITLQAPNAVSFDGAGNMYIADFGSTSDGTGAQLVKIPAAGGNAVVVSANAGGTALDGAADVQVDGAGDIFIADQDNNRIVELPVGGSPTSFSPTVNSLQLSSANDVIPGPNGLLYLSDGNNNRLIEIPNLGTGTATTVTSADGMNLNNPGGLALDSAGDLFIGDQMNNRVAEILAGGGAGSVYGPSIAGVSGDLSDAYGVFVDAANNLFITDFTGTGRLIEIPSGSTSGSVLAPNVSGTTLTAPSFMSTDDAGNFYVADYGTGRVFKFARTGSAPVATHFSVSAPGSATAGTSFSVTVTALTSSNATATSYTGTVHFTSSDGSAILPGNATLTNGVGTFSVTLKTAGSQSVTATDTVTGSITGSTSVTVNAAAATHLVIPGGPEPFYTAFGFTISAYDAYGNLATSYNGTVAFTSSDPGFANLGPVTLVNGTGSQTAVLKTAGVDSITATDTTTPSITGTGYFTVQPGPATYLGVSAPSSTYAGSPISVTVTAYDLYGNVATGYTGTVAFTSSDPQATLPAASPLTNGAGSFSATLATAGSQTVTATDTVTAGIVGTSGTISVSIPNYVVTVAADEAGTASNCTIQPTPGTNTTDTSCSLRDALAAASAVGSGNITFASAPGQLFSSAQTITLLVGGAGTLSIPSNVTITGPTSGSAYGLTNLVTVNGGGAAVAVPVFTGNATGGGSSISNLIITNGIYYGYGAGGIFNSATSTLTVTNSTISGNDAPSASGGIYNDGGTMTIINSTISGNSGIAGGLTSGPGGSLTVMGTTISGNSGNSAGGGLHVYNASATITNSTISGNTSNVAGGGIDNAGGAVNLSNTIVSGNTAPSNADIAGGYTDNGGNQISTAVNLSALGSNGGPTQTLVPQPGDAAICGGTLANATAAGITADQRGFVFDPHCPTGSVDSGAVQSNYGLLFGNVPHAAFAGQAITPAPTTTLFESGMVATTPTSAVTLSDAGSTLSGTTTQNLSSGTATFPGVSFTGVGVNTQLTATMALNSSVNLVATAGTTTTVSPAPAVLTSPAPSSTLAGPAATFSWSPAGGATSYSLWIGSTGPGSGNLYQSHQITASTVNVTALPTNGGTVYVRLYTIFNGVATPNDYTFTASTRAALTSPSPGTLSGPNVSFTWSPATGAVAYSLWLGSTGVGSSNLYNSGATTALTATANGLPTNGSTIYARINTIYAGGVSVSTDSTFTAATGTTAMLTTPTPSTTLSGARVTFTWTAASGATGYSLWIGSTGPGSGNLYQSHQTTALTATATNLPTNGAPVYVRLYTIYNGTSRYTDYTYTAAP